MPRTLAGQLQRCRGVCEEQTHVLLKNELAALFQAFCAKSHRSAVAFEEDGAFLPWTVLLGRRDRSFDDMHDAAVHRDFHSHLLAAWQRGWQGIRPIDGPDPFPTEGRRLPQTDRGDVDLIGRSFVRQGLFGQFEGASD